MEDFRNRRLHRPPVSCWMPHWRIAAGLICGAVLTLGGGYAARGDDQVLLRLRAAPQVTSHVVRLGDVVEILNSQGDNWRELLMKPIGPAPRAGQSQVWHQSDILQHLELRGVHPSVVRWSGPEQTTLTYQSPELQTRPLVPAFLSDRAVTQAQQLLARAIRDYLNHETGQRTEWQVQVEIPEQAVANIQSQRSILAIGGGQPPWVGEQKFTIKIRDGTATRIVHVTAEIQPPPMVLAAVRPMRRDEIITAADLTFVPVNVSQQSDDTDLFTEVQALVGKQLRRSISTGLPIRAEFVGEPILVHRGNLVQVQAVAGGVTVSTQGKTLGAGAAGELIEVEVLETRKRVLAVVVDPLTVRIAAQPTRTR